MEKVKEVIVVEGKDDLNRIKEVYKATVIYTNGFSFQGETINFLKKVLSDNEIIIFTDSDKAGKQIRERLVKMLGNNEKIKHAYLKKINKEVENTSKDEIKQSLEKIITFETKNDNENLTLNDLFNLGITGQYSKEKRAKVEKYFSIGKCSSKKLLERLNFFKINKEEIEKLIN